ncbi:MAG: shikimate kinase [Firmicutes bacterium]|nr:shikimate kinase [Bacillota bacterium]
MDNIVLIGFMGSGKTGVGRELSKLLSIPFYDMDDMLEQEAGMPIPEIFRLEGEEGFRKRESGLLTRLAQEKQKNASASVYSTGGGIVTRKENLPLLKKLGTVVFFKVNPGTALERVGDGTSRPMLAGSGREKRVRELMLLRTPMYLACADIVLAMDGYSKEENALRTKIVLQEHGCL